jgi:Domain of unknown function (DUF4150)
MPVTASVNGMTVVHKSSTGISQAFPDVCKTPAPPGPPIPIPYPNIAMSSDTADGSTSVKVDGNPIMLSTSKFATSSGDEAGSLFGVMSNKNKGSANPQAYSMDVKVEGKNVFRQLDIMLQNGGSKPTNTPPGPANQAPLPPGTPLQHKDWKIIEVRWSDAKLKCGDVVKIRTKTENYPDGIPIAHLIHKNGSKAIHDLRKGKVSGNAVEIDWITVNGPWAKDPTKLKVKAHGSSGVKESSGELEIQIPAEASPPPVRVPGHLNRAEVQMAVQVPKRILGIPIPFTQVTKIVGSGRFVQGAYGYDLTIKQGVYQIHCKVKLVPQAHVKTGKMRKSLRGLKAEIEGIWDRKWKEHRVGCQRGDKCGCPTGCCIFPIRVKCTFVPAGEHIVVNLWPGAPNPAAGPVGSNPNWWDQHNWYERLCGQEGNGAVVHAHEFGHSIGMEDEYVGGSTIPEFFDVPGSLMQSGTKVMKQHFERHPASGLSLHARFLQMVGGGYKLVPM